MQQFVRNIDLTLPPGPMILSKFTLPEDDSKHKFQLFWPNGF